MSDQAPGDAWSLAFARPDGVGGFLRLVRWQTSAWWWAYLAAPAWGLVAVRDHDLAPPGARRPIVVRGDGLWAELCLEQRDEHWTFGLEAFGVRLDDPLDAERGERGERLPVGVDLEWEVGEAPPFGEVHGELLVADERTAFDGTGTFEVSPVGAHTWDHESRRVSWQRDPRTGATARDAAVRVEADDAGLPTRVGVGDLELVSAAVAVVPLAPRVVLALVTGDGAAGWLEWCQASAASEGQPA